MNAASALLRSAENHGIVLWVEGNQLRYKARQPVSNGLKDRIREHKAEIITLLSTATPFLDLPEWCNPQCECLFKLDLPGLEVLQGCYQQIDDQNWRWARIEKMGGCPSNEARR